MEDLFKYFPENTEILSARVKDVEFPEIDYTSFVETYISIFEYIKANPFKKGRKVYLSKNNLAGSLARTSETQKFIVPIYSIEKIERDTKTNKLITTLGLRLIENYFPIKKSVSRKGQTPMPANKARQQSQQTQQGTPLVMYITLEDIKESEGKANSLDNIDKKLIDIATEKAKDYNPPEDPWANDTSSSASSSASSYASSQQPFPTNAPTDFNFFNFQQVPTVPLGWGGIPINQGASTSGTVGTSGTGGAKKYARLDTLTKQELIDRCRAKKIPYSGRNKAELVALLRK